MNIDKGFHLLVWVVFVIIPQLDGIRNNAQDLVALSQVIEGESLPNIVLSARWNLLPPGTLTRRTYTAT